MAKAKIVKPESKKKEIANDAASNAKLVEPPSPDHYQKLIKEDPLNQKAYHRLMILYRKSKEFKKELHIINSAIRSFDKLYKSHKKKSAKTIQNISDKLNKALGLTDKRGKATFDHEPVAGWKRRKEVVLKKMKK